MSDRDMSKGENIDAPVISLGSPISNNVDVTFRGGRVQFSISRAISFLRYIAKSDRISLPYG